MKTYRRQILIALFVVAASTILFQSVHVRAQHNSAPLEDAPAQDNAPIVKRDSSLAVNSPGVNKNNSPGINKDNSPTVNAERRGNPYINFTDGHALPSVFTEATALASALQNGNAQPRSLANADFDEDGVPDLLSGYAINHAGGFTLQRGNLDAIYPNTPEAERQRASGQGTSAAFLPEAKSVELPIVPDFIDAGDFDADGHFDVVAAAKGADALYLLRGDGAGDFSQPEKISLDGTLDALACGEINRQDDLTDLIVAVSTKAGARLLVYESIRGALKAAPEVFELPAAATSLALGQLDNNSESDLAVAAGRDLLIVHGRDRKSAWDAAVRAQVKPAKVERRSLDFVVRALAAGDFAGDARSEIAILAADDSLRLLERTDAAPTRTRVSHATQQSDEQIERNLEAHPELSTGKDKRQPSAPVTWRVSETEIGAQDASNIETGAAMSNAASRLLVPAKVSTNAKSDLLLIDSSASRLQIISNTASRESNEQQANGAAVVPLKVAATLDADAAPVAVLPMRLNMHAMNSLVMLSSNSRSPSIIFSVAGTTYTVNTTADTYDGLCNANCSLRDAINAANNNPGLDTIQFSVFGGTPTIAVNSSGLGELPYVTDPVTINGNTGGATRVELNFNALGTSQYYDGLNVGETLDGSHNASGSTIRALVINRIYGSAIVLDNASNCILENNYIGVDATGSTDINTDTYDGLYVLSSSNTIGGTTPAARNLIAGKGNGIRIGGSFGETLTDNVIEGNYIGLNASGTAVINNDYSGISISELGTNTKIGDAVAGAGNVIAGSDSGVTIYGNNYSTMGVILAKNLIGTNASGKAALPNRNNGVNVYSSGNTIGVASGFNLLSGNANAGVLISGGSTLVQNCVIGAEIQVGYAVPNKYGIEMVGGVGNQIGGALLNIISGNTSDGLHLNTPYGPMVSYIMGNKIGTRIDGVSALGNGGHGISISATSSSATIGRENAGDSNTIAFNGGDGISIESGASNEINANSIFSNAGLGIDLNNEGVTPNDANDADSGPNNLQNFPILNAANSDGTTTIVAGTLNSTPSATFNIKFFQNNSCDGSGNGEGQTFLASYDNVTTNNLGNVNFNFNLNTNVPIGQIITATATDISGNTSEFSACRTVSATSQPGALQFSSAAYNTNEGSATVTLTVTRTGGSDGAVSAQYTTSNNSAIAGQDYTATNGTLSWANGDTASKTFTVAIINDGINEATETFNVALNNLTGGATFGTPASAVVTILDNDAPQAVNAGQIIISEFRLSGPNQNSNEFVELYNNTDTSIRVGSFDGTDGWSVRACDNTGAASEVFFVPVGTVIPARGHFLATHNSAYSLGAVAAADAVYFGSMPENGALAIFKSRTAASVANRLDAVGFSSVADTLYREGNGLAPAGGISNASVEYSFVRKMSLANYPQDTNDNAADFVLVSTTGATLGGQLSVLGAPGPENLQSPVRRDTQLVASYTDPLTCGACSPNRVRVGSGNSGTLAFRRHFTNQTGATVTRLRFRVIDITTFNSPVVGTPPQAQLRVTNSANQSVSITLGTVTVQGTTLELPSANPDGGLNASLTTTLPAGGLPNGQGLDVQFVTNVIQNGRFRFFVGVEALP